MLAHFDELYAFYGEHAGVRVARKHFGWYRDAAFGDGAAPAHQDPDRSVAPERDPDALFRQVRVAESASVQRRLVCEWFEVASAAAGRAAGPGDEGQQPQWRRRAVG